MTLLKKAPRSAVTPALPGSNARRRQRFLHFLRGLKPWQRLACGVVLLPGVLAGGAGGAYYYNLHRLCSAMTLDGLPSASAPDATRRVLVLSPHCDDETLGAGALIADARRHGASVTVAFLTNGDGFRVAASQTLSKVNVGPADFVRFAEVRQHEAVSALHELGVPEKNIVFLGYPDRGLRPMWETNWDTKHLFQSGFTDQTHVPYPRAFTPHAPYCGAALTADLVRLMEQVQPTDILVTHPADDHPDHNAAPAFAQAALRECQTRAGDTAWAQSVRIRFYIVHRGDWPLPQGYHPERPLLPPPGLVTHDTRWNVFTAPPSALSAKTRALHRYVSQTQITGRFLSSFVRGNELFADLPLPTVSNSSTPPLAQVASGTGMTATVTRANRPGACETASDAPFGDNFMRYVEPGADLTGLAVSVEGDSLHVRLTTRGTVSPRLRYQVLLRGSETNPSGTTQTAFVSQGLRATTATTVAGGHALQMTVPLASLGLSQSGYERCVWVSAESRWAHRLPLIDRTGYRLFRFDNAAPPVKFIGESGRTMALNPIKDNKVAR